MCGQRLKGAAIGTDIYFIYFMICGLSQPGSSSVSSFFRALLYYLSVPCLVLFLHLTILPSIVQRRILLEISPLPIEFYLNLSLLFRFRIVVLVMQYFKQFHFNIENVCVYGIIVWRVRVSFRAVILMRIR